MLKRIVGVVGIASLGCSLALAAQAPATKPQGSPAAAQRAVVTRYCVTCHNEKVKTAGLMLDKMDVENPPGGAEVWEKVIRKLRQRDASSGHAATG